MFFHCSIVVISIIFSRNDKTIKSIYFEDRRMGFLDCFKSQVQEDDDATYGTPSVILDLRQSATMDNLLATLEDQSVKELGHQSWNTLNDVETMLKKSSRKSRSVPLKDFHEVNIFLQALLDLVSKLGGIYKVSKANLQKQYGEQVKQVDAQIQPSRSSAYGTNHRSNDETVQWYRNENYRLKDENQRLTKNLNEIKANRQQRNFQHKPWHSESNQSEEMWRLQNKLAASEQARHKTEKECRELHGDKKGLQQKILKLEEQVSYLNDQFKSEKRVLKKEMEFTIQSPQTRELKGRTGQNKEISKTRSVYDNETVFSTPYQAVGHNTASEYGKTWQGNIPHSDSTRENFHHANLKPEHNRLGRDDQSLNVQSQKVNELHRQVARKETEIVQLQRENNEYAMKLKVLEADVKKKDQNRSKKEKLNKEFSDRIVMLEHENYLLKKQQPTNDQGEVQRLETELQKLSEKLLFVESTLFQRDQNIANLKHDCELKCSEVHRLQSRETKLQESIDEMNKEKLAQATKRRHLEHDLKHSQNIVVELQQQSDTMNENIFRANKWAFDKKEEEILEMRALCDQKDREINSKKQEMEQLNSEVQRLQPYEAAASRKDANVKDLQHKINQHKAELDQMKLVLIEKDQINQHLQQCLASKDSKDVEIQNLQKHVTQLLSEENELKGKIKKLNSENKRCCASNDRLHQDSLTKEGRISLLLEQLTEEGRKTKQLEERIKRETEAVSQLKRTAKQDSQQHEKERLKHTNEIRQLELRLQHRENNVEDHRRQEEDISHLKDLCSQKDREIMFKQQEMDRLEAEIQNLSQDLRQMKLQVSAKDQTTQEIHLLERQVEKLKSEVTKKKGKIEEVNNEKKRCYASNERLHRAGCAKDEQISQLTGQLSQESKIRKQLEKAIAGEMEVKQQLQRRIEEQDSQIHQLQENIENSKQKSGKRTANREFEERLQK